jgi:hypothetical protein
MKPVLIISGVVTLFFASCEIKSDAALGDPIAPGLPGASPAAGTPETGNSQNEKKPVEISKSIGEPLLPGEQKAKDEGLRLPNMLGLPEDRDLKATNPATTASEPEKGGVISRPPVEKKD